MIGTDDSQSEKDQFAEVVESYYLETREKLFFAVKGLEHPPDRWIAVLRYAPVSSTTERSKDGIFYRRFYHFDEQEVWIRSAFPQYLSYDSIFRIELQSVPRADVVRIYDPRRRLRDLTSIPAVSKIEVDVRDFMMLLQNESKVPLSALGITGSLLAELHTENSDLDVVAFGEENCRKVHRALRRILDSGSSRELNPLDEKSMQDLYAQRVADTPMAFGEFTRLETRKVNQGVFRERPYFIRFIKDIQEANAVYGNFLYTPLGRVSITATITDDQDSIFTPCRYAITNVNITEGAVESDLREIVSFRGRFCEQAKAGESVCASGTLERLETRQGQTLHRLLLGNHPGDTLVSSRH